MITFPQGVKFLDQVLLTKGPSSTNPTIQLIYDIALTIFKVSAYTLFTYASPIGSLAVSLGICCISAYYQWIKNKEINQLLATTCNVKEYKDTVRLNVETVSRMNRFQHEFELVNLCALFIFEYLSAPVFLLCSGVSIWTWIDAHQTNQMLLSTINPKLSSAKI